MNINSICVCGAGTMGSGIAQVFATGGFRTTLYDLNENVLTKARESIDKNLRMLVEKNKISEDTAAKITSMLSFTTDVEECRADLVIEAIIENPEAKASLFTKLAEINGNQSIFATNTSSLSVTEIAEKISEAERFLGIHFFNPAQLMKLVEVINTRHTSYDVTNTVVTIINKLGKTPVICRDSPGFIVNRVARPYYIESLRIAEEGFVDMETIDSLMESAGFRMGPFKLMDLIGNDVNYAVSCSVYDQLNKPERLKPSYIQKEKVERGELGKKTGKGYYAY